MTPRQRQCLDFVAEFTAAAGFPPSYTDITDGLGLGSRARAHALVDALVRDGWLSRLPRQPRSLRVVRLPDDDGPGALLSEALGWLDAYRDEIAAASGQADTLDGLIRRLSEMVPDRAAPEPEPVR